MIELGSNEGIIRLSGRSEDHTGETVSFKATTTAGTWGRGEIHGPDGFSSSLRSSPDADNLTLRFISGDQTMNKLILR